MKDGKEPVSLRLRQVREHFGFRVVTTFATKLGWSKVRAQDLESGKVKNIRAQEAQDVARMFRINGWWLLTGEGSMFTSNEESIVTYVHIEGSPTGETLPFPKDIIYQHIEIGRAMCYIISTDNMSPTFTDGDIVIYDTANCNIIDGVFIVKIGDLVSCKRLQFFSNKVKAFHDNRNYGSITLELEEIEILGRVVMRFGKFQ